MISDSEGQQAARTNQQAAPTNQQAVRTNQQDAPTSQQEFAGISEEAVLDISNKLHIWDCFRNATDKAYSLGGDPNSRAAITWMSMYSRECRIPIDLLGQDENPSIFSFRLNKELRCTHYERRNARIRSIFVRVGDMIDKALDELRPIIYTNLYRGMEYFQYTNSSVFVEDGFFSTSKNISVALRFAKGNILIIIEQMEGVYIADYAQDKFKYQEEVLPKRQTMFMIKQKITEKSKIKRKIEKIKGRKYNSKLKQIIVITQYKADPLNVNMTSRRQQSESEDYCKPKNK